MSEKLNDEQLEQVFDVLENFDEVRIGRDIDNPEGLFEIIGKALYNGFEIHRTPKSITLKTSKGPVLDKPSED